jgi:hypothetical protein
MARCSDARLFSTEGLRIDIALRVLATSLPSWAIFGEAASDLDITLSLLKLDRKLKNACVNIFLRIDYIKNLYLSLFSQQTAEWIEIRNNPQRRRGDFPGSAQE